MTRILYPFLARLGLILAVGFLSACSRMDADELTARATAPQAGANCSSCHAYPLKDTHHTYHLFLTDSSRTENGAVSCMHCHRNSVVTRRVKVPDSIFVDSLGNQFSSWDFPRDSTMRLF